MTLAFVLFSWFPHGGLQQDAIKIARACRDRGAGVTVFCMQLQGEVPEDIDLQVIPVAGLSKTARRARFAAKVQELKARFDRVVGFNRMLGLDYYFAADTCFAWKAFTERGLLYRLAPRSRQYLAWERAVFSPDASTGIFLLSPQQRRQYTACYDTPAGRLFDLPPGIKRDFLPNGNEEWDRAAIRSELGLAEQDLLVLQVGSSYRIKGVDRSLRAIAALPAALKERVHYCLLGLQEPGKAKKLGRRLGLKRLHFPEPRRDVARFMRAADLLVHPSVRESAGMVILEAIVNGLPVLVSAECGYAFHVEAANAGLVCPEPFRQEEFNARLRRMLESGRGPWQQCGLEYGRSADLYDMPAKAAQIICGEEQHG